MKKINTSASFFRGQATVELMIILPLLLIILAVAISIFSQQMMIIDTLRFQHAVEQSAEYIAESVTRMSLMPPDSSARFYIPKSFETQTISLIDGLIEVKGSQYYHSILLPFANVDTFTVNDGNTLLFLMDNNSQLHVQVVS